MKRQDTILRFRLSYHLLNFENRLGIGFDRLTTLLVISYTFTGICELFWLFSFLNLQFFYVVALPVLLQCLVGWMTTATELAFPCWDLLGGFLELTLGMSVAAVIVELLAFSE